MFGRMRPPLRPAYTDAGATTADLHKAEEARRWDVFVEYHRNGGWAQAKAEIGGWLSDEAVFYMEAEIAARKEQERRYQQFMEKENAQCGTESNAAASAANGVAGPDPVPGPAKPETPHSTGGAGTGPDAHAEADR